MQITVTKPIEEFISRQVEKGYADASEVARQAFLRWMEEEDFDADPPGVREKLDEARAGKFRTFNSQSYTSMIGESDEARG